MLFTDATHPASQPDSAATHTCAVAADIPDIALPSMLHHTTWHWATVMTPLSGKVS